MTSRFKGKNKRASTRRPTLMSAQVLDPRMGVLARCTVRDFSGGGAKIEVEEPFGMPAVFWLKIKGDGTLRYCTAKWRSQHEVGVEFTRDKLLQIAEGEVSTLRQMLSWEEKTCKAG